MAYKLPCNTLCELDLNSNRVLTYILHGGGISHAKCLFLTFIKVCFLIRIIVTETFILYLNENPLLNK